MTMDLINSDSGLPVHAEKNLNWGAYNKDPDLLEKGCFLPLDLLKSEVNYSKVL